MVRPNAFSRNVIILGATSAGSYVLGLLRDRLLAQQFGASRDVDIFNSSFLLPDLIMNLFAAALTTAFIPVFAQVLHREHEQAAYRSANQVLTVIVTAIVSMNVLAWFLLPQLVTVIAPGFSADEWVQLTSTSRWLLFSPLLFGISTLLGAVLQAKHRFVSYALSPVFYNLGIVLGIVALAPTFGIHGVIFGVIIGAALHLGVRLVACLRLPYIPGLLMNAFQSPTVRHTLRLIGPRVVGLMAVQASLWTFNAVGSTLPAGSVAIFNFARNFQSLPVSFIGITIATVLFPVLAADFAAQQPQRLVQNAKRALLVIIGFSLPAMVVMMVAGEWLIGLLFGGGSYTATDIHTTALVLGVMSFAIPLESMQHILARIYYAQHNTKRPAIIAVCGAIVNAIVCILAAKQFGVPGLAIGFVVMTGLIDGLLFWPLRYQLMRRRTLWGIILIGSIGLLMMASVGYWKRTAIQDWLTPPVEVPESISYQDRITENTEKQNESAEEEETEETSVVVPEELNLAIPFTSQAPFANWDEVHEETCEEASILMAARFLQGRVIAGPQEADDAMLEMVSVEENDFGYGVSITAEQTAEVLEYIYEDLAAEVVYDFTWDDVKTALTQGYPVIVPAAGRELGNPNFTAPGPLYHMLVIKGYTEDVVITNDPGTRKGADYTYDYDTLYNAIHDWNGGDVLNGRKAIIIVQPK